MNMRSLVIKLCILLMALVGLSACAPTNAQIRAGLLMTARGIVEANRVCAHVAQEVARSKPTEALSIARTCSRVSNTAFSTLEAGEHAIDTVNAAGQKQALCAIASGLESMRAVLDAAKAAFGDESLPRAITDAVTMGSGLASLVAGQCGVSQ